MNIQHTANCHSFYLYDMPDIDCTLTWTDDRNQHYASRTHNTIQDSGNIFQLHSSIHVGLFHSLTGSTHATGTIITASLYTTSVQVYVHFLKLEYSVLWLILLTNIIVAAVINKNNNINSNRNNNKNSSSNNNNKPKQLRSSVTKA